MNSHPIPEFGEWADFDLIAQVLEGSLGWKPHQKAEGPDARSWSFVKKDFQVWLVYDDLLGIIVKSENKTFDLASLAAAILVVLKKQQGQI